jgi:hypothetical protein
MTRGDALDLCNITHDFLFSGDGKIAKLTLYRLSVFDLQRVEEHRALSGG